MAKKVPVTSVTPKSKVTAVSKTQQARTRKLVGAIASVTPVGRAAGAASKAMQVRKVENANKRALKAANKPVKNKDASVMNRNNPYARQAILKEKPARPNRVRGGSMRSKLDWPEGMKRPVNPDSKVQRTMRIKEEVAAKLKDKKNNSKKGIF
jgi:hypothetical protein